METKLKNQNISNQSNLKKIEKNQSNQIDTKININENINENIKSTKNEIEEKN